MLAYRRAGLPDNFPQIRAVPHCFDNTGGSKKVSDTFSETKKLSDTFSAARRVDAAKFASHFDAEFSRYFAPKKVSDTFSDDALLDLISADVARKRG